MTREGAGVAQPTHLVGATNFSASPTPGQPVDVSVMVYIEAIQEIDPKLSTTGEIFQIANGNSEQQFTVHNGRH